MWAYVAAVVATQVYSYVEGSAAAAKKNAYLEGAAQNAETTGRENRRIYENNARLAAQEATTERALGEKNALGEKQKGMVELGAGKVVLGSAGVDLLNAPEGSSAFDYFGQVAADYQSKSEYETWKGDYAAWQKDQEAKSYNRKGYLAEWEGNSQAWSLRSSKTSGPSLMGTALQIGATVAMANYMNGSGSMFASPGDKISNSFSQSNISFSQLK